MRQPLILLIWLHDARTIKLNKRERRDIFYRLSSHKNTGPELARFFVTPFEQPLNFYDLPLSLSNNNHYIPIR